MFHLPTSPPPVSTAPFKPYDPNKWASATFGFPQAALGAAGKGLEDIEMRNADSPTKPHEVGGEADTVRKDGKENRDGNDRPMAGGAVSRVRRKRQKEWKRGRGRGSESEGEGEGSVSSR